MRQPLFFLAASSLFLLFAGCSSGNQSSKAATEENIANAAESEDPCGNVMQQIADNCFATTAFQKDGTTPARVLDEAGNDLGEVDQQWATQYCECYAQLTRQTFSCDEILEHENLDDAAYETTYAEIIRGCTEATLIAPAKEAAEEANAAADADNDAAENSAATSDADANL